MSESSRAVFLSYASQDTQAAQRICDALRAVGVEVWFDRDELRSGDAWDQKIRGEIRDCALFIPVISANTVARHEGYFRLEWDLADQRTHMIARNRAFIVPVCIDSTPETAGDVPESFQRVQWTRLQAGEPNSAFIARIARLLSGDPPSAHGTTATASAHGAAGAVAAHSFGKLTLAATVASALAAIAYFASRAPATFKPPPHSIAVLPFTNMSGDREQDYFSEGLSEELLNSLAEINQLQVAGRTSSFYFKGKDVDLGTIAHKLNVADVLEGSVRRSGETIRVTAQLTNAITGFQVWSHTYDRDAGDILKLQTEISNAVAQALEVTLLGDASAKIQLGGTHNAAAFDAYLRAEKLFQARAGTNDIPAAVAAYAEAISSDPNYALAFAARSYALSTYAAEVSTDTTKRDAFAAAEADAKQAIALAPDLAESHLAVATYYNNGPLDLAKANVEYERALALAPGNARILRTAGANSAYIGHSDTAIAAMRRAVVLDPLARSSHTSLGLALYLSRQYKEAAAAYAAALSLNPNFQPAYAERGLSLFGLGDLKGARASCEVKRDFWYSQQCLAIVYDKLGRHEDAEKELAKIKAAAGDSAAYQYATIYAQWGDRAKAIDWLETAVRLRDPGLFQLKTEPLLDPVHQEPRFQAILRSLKFP